MWVKAGESLSYLHGKPDCLRRVKPSLANPTEKIAETRAFYSERIEMVNKAAKEASSSSWIYILREVAKGHSYDIMSVKEILPCSKDEYYKCYRKFFYILSKYRN